MLIPSIAAVAQALLTSLSRRVNANSQPDYARTTLERKLIKKGEC